MELKKAWRYLRVTDDEILEVKIYLPLTLLFWIPITFAVGLALFYHIRWDYFGITDGVSQYYLNNFESSFESYLWMISEIGIIGMSFFSLLAICYLWMWGKVWVAIFY